MPLVQELKVPEPTAYLPPINRGLFSAFRTHFNVPLPLFHALFTPSTDTTAGGPTSAKTIDLEKQAPPHDTTQHAINIRSPVKTNIWSGDYGNVPNPNAPKMGIRAYRQWEKREKSEREDREGIEVTIVLPDNVHTDKGPPDQGWKVGHGGVEVKRDFVQKEEVFSTSSSCTR